MSIRLKHSNISINLVKENNKLNGGYWFSPETMRFFKSRIESPLFEGDYFITSELVWGIEKRLFHVRKVKDHQYWGIEHIDKPEDYPFSTHFESLEDAKLYIYSLLNSN